MCLTLGNAAAVHEYRTTATTRRGYTETLHHVGHLAPGDLWRPVDDCPPHVVTDIRSRGNSVTITDHLGQIHRYATNAIVPTAVPDPLVLRPVAVPRSA